MDFGIPIDVVDVPTAPKCGGDLELLQVTLEDIVEDEDAWYDLEKAEEEYYAVEIPEDQRNTSYTEEMSEILGMTMRWIAAV
ncbi:hypothetical protein GN958_ATG04603 [Phytophthora infestans]|uniref:Uncharacterized protein n=1 Tax=Phytophthora infestans TaxID=4787 RepID=A0A8S9V6I2_PHYIN|nr:hypothetical protein GN958_ATG04603 [Phytophthora infestans]